MSVALAPAFGAGKTLEKCHDIPDREARLDCFDTVPQGRRGPGSYLSNLWKLGPGQERIGIDQLQPHRPVYILLDRWTTHVNQTPSSPAPGRSVTTPFDLNPYEAKFQLSFKSELLGLRRELDRLQLPAAYVRPGFRVPRVVSGAAKAVTASRRRHRSAHCRGGAASCAAFLSTSVISMRRFFFRPSALSFSAMG
jgi:hypothetical protein